MYVSRRADGVTRGDSFSWLVEAVAEVGEMVVRRE